jgi:hypothetical protein
MDRDEDGVTLGDHRKEEISIQIFNKSGMHVCAIKHCAYFPANHAHQIKSW